MSDEILDLIDELHEKYDVRKDIIEKYYLLLCKYPFTYEDDNLYTCLEYVVRDSAYNKMMRKMKRIDAIVPTRYSISNALYNVYEDLSISYLDEQFIKINNISNEMNFRR